MLAWFLNGFGVTTEFRHPDVIQHGLFVSLETADLIEYPMFAELLRRTAA
jgi:hypothetical protein